jgi:hypothetical protein
MKRLGRELKFSGKYHGKGRLGHATFNGRHNRDRVMIYSALYLYSQLYPRGRGLTSNEIASVSGLELFPTRCALTRSLKWRFISAFLHLGRTARRYYRIDYDGRRWLYAQGKYIPWEKYNLEDKGWNDMGLRIIALVRWRGFQ